MNFRDWIGDRHLCRFCKHWKEVEDSFFKICNNPNSIWFLKSVGMNNKCEVWKYDTKFDKNRANDTSENK